MATEKRLIDANALSEKIGKMKNEITHNRGGYKYCNEDEKNEWNKLDSFDSLVCDAPTVDAVEMPKGKPGDYLEWDNGTGLRQIYHIHSVMICEHCMRYDLGKFAPAVNHPGIVRIMSREEAEKEWHERCERERTQEEPTLTAVYGERKDNESKAD
jgi:hypothetical protein